MPFARREQPFDASHVAKVGHRLAGEYRIVGKPALLGALDLGVPVRALDQADRQPAPRCGCNVLDPIDDSERALLIGLHREAESVPVAQRSVAQHGGDDLERELEPVGLLGIDGELQIAVARQMRQFDQPRHQLLEHALARHRFVARMQRRELDRDAGPLRQCRVAGLRADGRDRAGIGVEIFVGVGRGARALAEHVERVAEFA